MTTMGSPKIKMNGLFDSMESENMGGEKIGQEYKDPEYRAG